MDKRRNRIVRWKWKKRWIEHPIHGFNIDVVAIPIDENCNDFSYKECFNINEHYNLDVTEKVFILGYPFGYAVKSKEEPRCVWSSGTIASDSCLELVINSNGTSMFNWQ